MENLERLASSVAQVELLIASLKRENRDLSNRLAAAALERRQAQEALEEQAKRHSEALAQAQESMRPDPVLELRAGKAEAESAELAERLADREARITRLETECLDLSRQLHEAQIRLAEAATPDEVAGWQARLAELEGYRQKAEALEAQGARLADEKTALRAQRKELAAFSKERANLKRRMQELLATLESVRLG